MKEGGRRSLRKDAEALTEQAARAGMENAGRLARMTPREIEMEIEAFSAERQRRAEEMDLLAWLAGRYVLTALHAPRRYPMRPDGVARRPREMTQENMKRVFAAMAGRREKNGGS